MMRSPKRGAKSKNTTGTDMAMEKMEGGQAGSPSRKPKLKTGTEEALWFSPANDYVKQEEDVEIVDFDSDDENEYAQSYSGRYTNTMASLGMGWSRPTDDVRTVYESRAPAAISLPTRRRENDHFPSRHARSQPTTTGDRARFMPSYIRSHPRESSTGDMGRYEERPMPSYTRSQTRESSTGDMGRYEERPMPSYIRSQSRDDSTGDKGKYEERPMPSYTRSQSRDDSTGDMGRYEERPMPSYTRSQTRESSTGDKGKYEERPMPSYIRSHSREDSTGDKGMSYEGRSKPSYISSQSRGDSTGDEKRYSEDREVCDEYEPPSPDTVMPPDIGSRSPAASTMSSEEHLAASDTETKSEKADPASKGSYPEEDFPTRPPYFWSRSGEGTVSSQGRYDGEHPSSPWIPSDARSQSVDLSYADLEGIEFELKEREKTVTEEIDTKTKALEEIRSREAAALEKLTALESELGALAESPPFVDSEVQPMLDEKTLDQRILQQRNAVMDLTSERMEATGEVLDLGVHLKGVKTNLQEVQQRKADLKLVEAEQSRPKFWSSPTGDDFALLGRLPRVIQVQKQHADKLLLSMGNDETSPGLNGNIKPVDVIPSQTAPGEDTVVREDAEIWEKAELLSYEYQKLKDSLQYSQSHLGELKERIGSLKPVQKLIQLLTNERRKFVAGLFHSIKCGNMRDVQYICAALDLKDPETGLAMTVEDLVEPSTGLSVLHTALMAGKDDIVRFLGDHSGDVLVRKSVVTSECANLTALYMGVVRGDINVVQYLVGEIEKEEDRVEYVNRKLENHTAGLEFGELPLAASVWSCMNREMGDGDRVVHDIITYLTSEGADMELANSEGNTLLHLLVLQAVDCPDHLPYFRSIIRNTLRPATRDWYYKKHVEPMSTAPDRIPRPHIMKRYELHGLKHLMQIENRDKLTPLTLAAQVESPLFEDLINMENVVRFSDPKLGNNFSSVETYNVTAVSSLKPDGSYNKDSVMHVLAHNQLDLAQRSWKTDIVDTEPLRTIIDVKWKVYRWFFSVWCLVHLVFMILFSVFTLQDTDEGGKNATNATTLASAMSLANVTKEPPSEPLEIRSSRTLPVGGGNPYFAFFLSLPVFYLIFEIVDIFWNGRLNVRYTMTGNALYRLVIVLFSVTVILWFGLHMARSINQDIILAIALLLGWIFPIFFTRTMKFPSENSQIGAFSIMMQRMLFHDLVPFMVISCFILVSFSTAFHATVLHSKDVPEEEKSFRLTFFQMLNYYSSLEDTQGYEPSREQEFAKLLLTVYGILSVILMVNMLIAAMNKSYEIIRDTKTNLVVRQRLAILLLLERRLPRSVQRRSELMFDKIKNHRTNRVEKFLRIVTESDVGRLIKKSRKS